MIEYKIARFGSVGEEMISSICEQDYNDKILIIDDDEKEHGTDSYVEKMFPFS